MKRPISGAFLLVVAGAALYPVASADLSIVEVEAWTDGTARLVFEDTDPPAPYMVERFVESYPDSPWQPLPWYALACTRPAQYEVLVPGAVQSADFYRLSVGSGTGLPMVIACDPANGANNVSTDRSCIRVTFDRPMAGTAGIQADPSWGASYVTWSEDHRTAELHRLSVPAPLPMMGTLRFTLNAGGDGFADTEGRPLPGFRLAFSTEGPEVTGPCVLSSYPPNGARDVDPAITTVELRFSEPMLPAGGFMSTGWWPWILTWSEDGLTAYVRREETALPLYGHTVRLSPMHFRTAGGIEMTADYTLEFSTARPPSERVEANPAKGFSWPYYLLVPPAVTAPGTLLVEPNNSGTWEDDPWFHEQAALALLIRRSSFAIELGCPLLVPVFPRPMNPAAPEPGGLYVHALDRYSLSDQWAGLQRIDLQLVAMVDDALERLCARGTAVDDRVFMMGFSASGAFTSRFAALHPGRVKAVAPGSPGGWPCAPVSSWQGVPLPYPFGVQDVPALTGDPFDLDRFKQVAFYIYVGGIDTNDAVDFRGLPGDTQNLIKQLLNYPADGLLANRWPLAEAMFASVGARASFVVYPGIGHSITNEMYDDLLDFFTQNR